jgi:hypothetical protein
MCEYGWGEPSCASFYQTIQLPGRIVKGGNKIVDVEIMALANCHLCGQPAELVESHVWPKFAYKRYVSDLSKGGSFLDLRKGAISNAQYKRAWFCPTCDNERLGSVENSAAGFCRTLEAGQSAPVRYDDRFLRFATSVSWRTLKLWMEEQPTRPTESLKRVLRQWKDFLNEKKNDVGPFTQHLFVVFGALVDWHKALGGTVFSREQVVLSQVGPLFIAGLLERNHLNASERRSWDHSKIARSGGQFTPVKAWRVPTELTRDFARLLKRHEVTTAQRIINLHDKPMK